MLDLLTLGEFDRQFTTAINGCSADWCDPVMLFVSKVPVWFWLYALIAVILVRKMGWRKGLLAIAALALTCLLTDQIANLLKNNIQRLRPCEDALLDGIIRPVAGHSSLYGFPSGHAANTFGFALLSSMLIRKRYYSILIFLWAAVISYSRIYLGKHYLGDVIAGAILGTLIAYCLFISYRYIERKCFV